MASRRYAAHTTSVEREPRGCRLRASMSGRNKDAESGIEHVARPATARDARAQVVGSRPVSEGDKTMKTMNQLSDHPPTRPLRRRIQARAMRVVNVPMRLLLRLPFPAPLGGRLMLVSYTGRKTGRSYHQPVSYVRQG